MSKLFMCANLLRFSVNANVGAIKHTVFSIATCLSNTH